MTKITYKLYSEEFPEGKELAVLRDENQAAFMEPYFRQVYGNSRFKVTSRRFRKKEEHLTGYWEVSR